jgi:hypothetical protein
MLTVNLISLLAKQWYVKLQKQIYNCFFFSQNVLKLQFQ